MIVFGVGRDSPLQFFRACKRVGRDDERLIQPSQGGPSLIFLFKKGAITLRNCSFTFEVKSHDLLKMWLKDEDVDDLT